MDNKAGGCDLQEMLATAAGMTKHPLCCSLGVIGNTRSRRLRPNGGMKVRVLQGALSQGRNSVPSGVNGTR